MDDKQQQYATINAEALKAENNKIYKLVSFTIAKPEKKYCAV
jgi:tRNA A22 N-methylase